MDNESAVAAAAKVMKRAFTLLGDAWRLASWPKAIPVLDSEVAPADVRHGNQMTEIAGNGKGAILASSRLGNLVVRRAEVASTSRNCACRELASVEKTSAPN
jgi:hypothetical protein